MENFNIFLNRLIQFLNNNNQIVDLIINENYKKIIDDFFEKNNISFTYNKYIYSFKFENTFYKLSLINNDQRLLEFYSLHINFIKNFNQKQQDTSKIKKSNYFYSTNNSSHPLYNCPHNGTLLSWNDEENNEKINYLDPQTLYKLFKGLCLYQPIFFENLKLDDLYFSKTYECFLVKNFTTLVTTQVVKFNSPSWTYHPKNILTGKSLFETLGNELIFSEVVELPTNSHLEWYK